MNRFSRVAGLTGALAAMPALAHAGGLFVPGAGPQAQGRAGAFVAKADDPSALLHNPAGFAKLDGWVISIGANLVDYDLTFTRAGSYESASGANLSYEGQAYDPVEDVSEPEIGVGPFQIIPLIAISGDIGVKNLRVGAGIYAPQAFPNREFTPDYTFEEADVPPPPQRYDMMYQRASTVLPSVAVAYRIMDNLDVGARLSWGFGEVSAQSYVWGIRNYEEWVARDGVFEVDVGDNFIPAAGLGALYRVGDTIEIGFGYSSAVHFDGKGTGTSVLGSDLGLGPNDPEFIEPENEFFQCEAGGTAEALKACLTLTLPQTASLGGRYILRNADGSEMGDVELDVRWEDWSAGSDVDVIVDGKSGLTGIGLKKTTLRHGFRDVISVRLGGSYNLNDQLGLRGGVAYDTAAAPNSWQRADLDGAARTTLGAGVSYRVGSIRVDAGGGFVYEPNRTVEECNPTVGSEGCPPGSGVAVVDDRNAPDPAQPLLEPNQAFQSPFNAGKYESSYLLLTLGLTYFIE